MPSTYSSTTDPSSQATDPMLAAALALVKAGKPLFPLNGKKPFEPGGFHNASTDPERIREWGRLYPGCNWGMPTGAASGVDVLDLDGPEGLAWLAEHEAEHGPLPHTPAQITGGGGRPIFFRHAEGLRINAGKIAPHVDLRAEGGYVVIPPSINPMMGKRYEWEAGRSLLELEAEPWPKALLAIVQASSKRT